jgi:hypothetical protein
MQMGRYEIGLRELISLNPVGGFSPTPGCRPGAGNMREETKE